MAKLNIGGFECDDLVYRPIRSINFRHKKLHKKKRSRYFKKYLKATKILQRVNKKYSLKLTDDEIKFIVDSAYYDSKESEGKNGI